MGSHGFDDGDELTILSREELEQRVRQRTAALENVMDTMVDVLVKLGPDGRIRMVNAAASTVLGYERDALVGKPIDHLLADDRPCPQDTSSTTGPSEFVETLLRENRITEFETALVTVDGDEIPTSLSASVLRDEDGAIEGVVCVATDISERVAAEERAEFLHSLLRHDLGNKLTVAHGYLELLSESTHTEQNRQYLAYAREGIESAIDLVENVRTLNRLDDDEALRPLELAPALEESADRHADLAERAGVDVDIDVESDAVVLAGSLLTELFANLIENALVHSGGSEIRIAARSRESTVRVTVDDDGRGIPPARRDELLERGETHGTTGGSGLGTYLAARIATTYGGDLTIDDSPLGGARVTVTLRRPG